MNTRVVEINNKKVTLTERPASDVQDVFDYQEEFSLEERQNYKILFRIAVWVCYQSLRSTRKNIPVWLFWKKIPYLKYSVKYLAARVAPHVLFSSQAIVMQLDELDSKKKVETKEESESPDLKQNY